MTTTVSSVQIYGQRATWPADVVYVGMPCKPAIAFGIPFSEGLFGKPWECRDDPRGWLEAYREYLWDRINSDGDFALAVRALHGKTLLCWCTAKAAKRGTRVVCHAETLVAAIEWLQGNP